VHNIKTTTQNFIHLFLTLITGMLFGQSDTIIKAEIKGIEINKFCLFLKIESFDDTTSKIKTINYLWTEDISIENEFALNDSVNCNCLIDRPECIITDSDTICSRYYGNSITVMDKIDRPKKRKLKAFDNENSGTKYSYFRIEK
jgi:hypothetical protein